MTYSILACEEVLWLTAEECGSVKQLRQGRRWALGLPRCGSCRIIPATERTHSHNTFLQHASSLGFSAQMYDMQESLHMGNHRQGCISHHRSLGLPKMFSQTFVSQCNVSISLHG